MSSQLSRSEIVREIVKCGKDSAYFINNYARISHPLKGLIPFKTYSFQDDLLLDFDAHRFNVILKARQLGISTITAAYIVWLLLFYRDKNVLVIATKFQTAANLVKKVKSIMQNVPPWLKIAEIKIDNKGIDRLVNSIYNKNQKNKKILNNSKKPNFTNYKIDKVKDRNINDYKHYF